MKNTRRYANLILKPQVEFTAARIRALKEFFNAFFDRPPQHQESKALALETGEELQVLLQTLQGYKLKIADYPFLANLEKPLAVIAGLTGKSYAYYLTEMASKADELLDFKEDRIDPLLNFMTGSRRKNYDEIRKFLQDQEPNFSYLENDAENRLRAIINNPFCYRSNAIHEATILLEETRREAQRLVEKEREKAVGQLDAWEKQVTGLKDFAVIPGEFQQEIRETFKRIRESLASQNLIAVINDTVRRFEDREYRDCLNKVISWKPAPVLSGYSGEAEPSSRPGRVVDPVIESISQTIRRIAFDKPMLVDENDVEVYLGRLKKMMLREIDKGKKIQV